MNPRLQSGTVLPRRAQSESEIARRDGELLQIVDQWANEAYQRGGANIHCGKGCAQCCVGVFAIHRLDALRLQRGLNALADIDPERAQRVLQRAAASLEHNVGDFPGDMDTGLLYETPEAQALFEEYANDEPCPALDPETQSCDLYAYRPMTCRVYGPPLDSADGIGVCELNFAGASPEEVSAALVPLRGQELEEELVARLERNSGCGKTIVAFALLGA
ncbi:MAG: YkgJ family cysteine cluster protein [Acidobacteriota bacterium]|nr:YkgJ family cysteine cluster protein [Acidobacteriota bacterium]